MSLTLERLIDSETDGPGAFMLGMPATTDFDVKFRLLGIPVRINPLFWVVTAMLGWGGRDRGAAEVLVWIACVFISILVHEFGHGLTTRALFHNNPSIVLYGMGGLCFSNGEERHLWKRALVIIMGPGAGFLLFGLVAVAGTLILGIVGVGPFLYFHHQPPRWVTPLVWLAYSDMLYINLFWGLVNLLPIYPLDGGQLTQVFLTMHDRRQGARRGYIVGLVTAGLIAIWLFSRGTQEDYFNAFFVAYLAMINYQLLQASHYQQSYGDSSDDDDWWRR